MIGNGRMNHQFTRPAVTQADGGEVTHVARGQPTDAERLGESHDRTVDKAKGQIGEALVYFHST